MKKLITLFAIMLLTCFTSNLTAQVIDSLAIIPTNPTTTDTVKIICYTTWMYVVPGQPCGYPLLNSSLNINNNEIDVYKTPLDSADSSSIVLWVLCNSIDTITVGRLNAGTYDLTYHLGSTSDTTVTFQVQTTPGCIDSSLITSIVCIYVYDPVCGCDNITYFNFCYATFNGGVTSYTNGPCVTTGIGEKIQNQIKTYPNPVTSYLVVEVRYPLQLVIYNVQGKLMVDKAISSTYTMDLSELARGIYFLTATDELGRVYSEKVVKE